MRWEHAQHNPEKKNKNGKVVRRYAWNVQCAGNMRSIILNKKTQKLQSSLGSMLGMSNVRLIMN
jgi:hypothetical protein